MKSLLPRLWLWLLALCSAGALLAMTFNIWPGIPVRSNIMELLPALRDDSVLLQALKRSNKTFSSKLLIVVGDKDAERTKAAAALVENSIKQRDFFSAPMTGVNMQQAKAVGTFYFQWRNFLLSQQQYQWLRDNNTAAFEQQLMQALYSPISGINAALLTHDPLLTFYHFLRALPPPEGRIQNRNGVLQVHGKDRDYRVIVVDIQRDVFDMAFHPAYTQWRNTLQQQMQQQFPQTELLLMGAVEHAVWGASSAKHEVSTIGNGSLLGIIVLMVWIFRSQRVLWLSLLPLGTGVLAGLLMTLLFFKEVHLITLVFGSSVIGVAMDYSLHYLCEHYKNPTHKNILSQVLPGITMAMLTSAIAYAAIGFAPFPVLRQVALFSCAGLVGAWLTVVCFYPSLVPIASFHHPRYLQWSHQLDHQLCRWFENPRNKIFFTLFVLAMLPGVLRIQANDDLRLLQTPVASISTAEKKVQALTGLHSDGRFFLIEGNTTEQLLQREEQMRDDFSKNSIAVDVLSNTLPSQQRQYENFSLLKNAYQNIAPTLQEKYGLPADAIQATTERHLHEPTQWLTPEIFFSSPQASAAERFQLTQTTRGWISAGFAASNAPIDTLRNYATTHEGVHWMDPVADISALFKHYREQTGAMMLLAYAVIAALLCWRYGFAQAWHVMLAPALAAWVTLGLLGYAGVAINLFHVLALLLVLGVGIDYSVFFAESAEHRDTTMLAVLLSTSTTLLSFGLLALSETAAIRSFGIVVSIGMVCALLFSPLARHKNART